MDAEAKNEHNRSPVETDARPTNADVFLQCLEDAGMRYIFAVLGSDHASLIDGYEKRKQAGKLVPELLIFDHEFVAISAADGHARMTGQPQCVVVHVDVGTAALGQGLHNASSGRVPLLIFAGEAPTTMAGIAGSRSEHVHWYQDVRGQERIVEPYSRYTRKLAIFDDIRLTVSRALLMASTGSPGPVYLTATREVLAAEAVVNERAAGRVLPRYYAGDLPDLHVRFLGDALLKAQNPLVITGYLGRKHTAVKALVRLANLVKPLQVIDMEHREMSFPATHPAKLTLRTGGPQAIKSADLILVLDADVPWIPTKVAPSPGATIYHIDCDPRKDKMQLFDISAEMTWNADSGSALEMICNFVESEGGEQRLSSADYESRGQKRESEHVARLEKLASAASDVPNDEISADMLFAALRKVLPKNTVFPNDVVTNQGKLAEQLQLATPGTFLTKGGSGLGWSLGASIGVKLATRDFDLSNRPHTKFGGGDDDTLVCCVTGDGAYMFGGPEATFLNAAGLGTPFLTVVVNNGGWNATKACVKDVHPGGVADLGRDGLYNTHHRRIRPDHVGVAKAASGNTMWGLQVARGSKLNEALEEAANFVLEEKSGAILEVMII